MRPKYKLGTWVKVATGDETHPWIFDEVKSIMTSKDGYAYILETSNDIWAESAIAEGYRPITRRTPKTKAQKSRGKKGPYATKTTEAEVQ